MTLTINLEAYGQLLSKYLLQVITNEIENERAIDIAETLSNKQDLTPEEEQLLDLLTTLIEKFESQEYSFDNNSTPLSRLHFLIEANNLKQVDLLDVFGSKGIASEVFNGKRQISKTHAVRLSKKFNVDPALFLEDARLLQISAKDAILLAGSINCDRDGTIIEYGVT